ncbi:hypothetical protein MBAV_003974 [Candidatus Magnetobacterium bavaricum]|uniref:Uncharacterized protein n=1 Tax=Candidatus Magnetobacterium bavaricum TaxID=29290 RepID=A0A0F3GPM1_9BACT|nr:hypothetical protein MBAV_003974 [Candidatus Magnetobacterium bavaricum]
MFRARASIAFCKRFINTCSSWLALPATCGKAGSTFLVRVMFLSRIRSPMSRRLLRKTKSMSVGSISTSSRRPKVRRCWIISTILLTCLYDTMASFLSASVSRPPCLISRINPCRKLLI